MGVINLFVEAWILNCLLSSLQNILGSWGEEARTHSVFFLNWEMVDKRLERNKYVSATNTHYKLFYLKRRFQIIFFVKQVPSTRDLAPYQRGTTCNIHIQENLGRAKDRLCSVPNPLTFTSESHLFSRWTSLLLEPIKYTYHSKWSVLERRCKGSTKKKGSISEWIIDQDFSLIHTYKGLAFSARGRSHLVWSSQG